jgi:hypothetical protein
MWGSPVTITDSQLVIPQPEWKALAAEAQQDASFAVQLQGTCCGEDRCTCCPGLTVPALTNACPLGHFMKL